MNLSRDETRALGFVALLLTLSATVRFIDRPRPVSLDAAGVDVTALEVASRAAAKPSRAPPLAVGEEIDLNTAPREDLLRLPRMTARIAEAILGTREATPFRSLEDVDRVPGVGPAALKAWQPFLTLPAARTRPPEGPGSQIVAAVPRAPAAPLALNAATSAELERLPGIGPALAARIVAWRDSAGGFRNLDDLAKVRGIGPATLARLKPLLTL
jgi:competence protein ComEA